jgi:hypothetical protein
MIYPMLDERMYVDRRRKIGRLDPEFDVAERRHHSW